MNDIRLSRRDAIEKFGEVVLAGAVGTQAALLSAAEPARADGGTVIDAHIHVVKPRLPGVLAQPVPLAPFENGEAMTRLARMIEGEAKKAGVHQALCMPRVAVSDEDPLGIKDTLAVAENVQGLRLHPVGVAHPERFDRDHLARVEEVLQRGTVKALKAYLGYFHYEPFSLGYRSYFKLAAKYNVPVIFHCGDTYSRTAKVKYAHPLKIDEIAVDFPETKFVIAHFGNPWLMDAAQVIYKNKNVWADLSAFLIGDAQAFATMEKEGALDRVASRIKEAVAFTESPDKFLFGSDWPLSPIVVYRDFVRRLFPEELHAAVFGETAKTLFGL